MTNTHELLKKFTEKLIHTQNEDGSFPPGHNGPYNDCEYPTRNTAHILFLFSVQYTRTQDIKLKEVSEKAINYLFSKDVRPHDKTFYFRNKNGKNKCNGLIGQAWMIETLVKASKVFNRSDCYKLAERIFLLHPFNEKVGLWHIVEVDGHTHGFDATFNHQLWFAMAGALLTETPVAQWQAKIFMDKVASNVELYPNGTIFHTSQQGRLQNYYKLGLHEFLKQLKHQIKNIKRRKTLYLKSIAYHSFNLYAFSLLYKAFPELHFWKSETFSKLLNAPNNILFQRDLLKSEFSYFYNVTGVEIAFTYEVFGKKPKEIQKWLNYQFEYTFQNYTHLFTKGSKDINISQARVYELARLNGKYEIELDLTDK